MGLIERNSKVPLIPTKHKENPYLVYHLKKTGDFFNIKLDHILINFDINMITFHLNENKYDTSMTKLWFLDKNINDYKENEFKKLTPNKKNNVETSSENDFVISHYCYSQDNFYLFNLRNFQYYFKYSFDKEKDMEKLISTKACFLKYIEFSTMISKSKQNLNVQNINSDSMISGNFIKSKYILSQHEKYYNESEYLYNTFNLFLSQGVMNVKINTFPQIIICNEENFDISDNKEPSKEESKNCKDNSKKLETTDDIQYIELTSYKLDDITINFHPIFLYKLNTLLYPNFLLYKIFGKTSNGINDVDKNFQYFFINKQKELPKNIVEYISHYFNKNKENFNSQSTYSIDSLKLKCYNFHSNNEYFYEDYFKLYVDGDRYDNRDLLKQTAMPRIDEFLNKDYILINFHSVIVWLNLQNNNSNAVSKLSVTYDRMNISYFLDNEYFPFLINNKDNNRDNKDNKDNKDNLYSNSNDNSDNKDK